ncbi:MAG: formate dehydrogenase, partial [Bacillota bacterium]|nr:formate dehydrogenase [Bacillota bacterium]
MLERKLVSARCGVINPMSIDDYLAHDGYKSLEKAMTLTKEAVIAEVKTSGLRGRGGAGFPTAMKMASLAIEADPEKYIVCNADEG